MEGAGVGGDFRHLKGSQGWTWQSGDVHHEGLLRRSGVVGHLQIAKSGSIHGKGGHPQNKLLKRAILSLPSHF